jgi:hypothetical protein
MSCRKTFASVFFSLFPHASSFSETIMSSFFHSRRIQEADNTSTLIPHWGYASRVLPCTNDAGSCEYLDAVYWMHDTSMLYAFILWAVIGFAFIVAIALRLLKPASKAPRTIVSEDKDPAATSSYYQSWRGIQGSMRKVLLPESFVGFFGHVTRLQLLVLAILLFYLLIFS